MLLSLSVSTVGLNMQTVLWKNIFLNVLLLIILSKTKNRLKISGLHDDEIISDRGEIINSDAEPTPLRRDKLVCLRCKSNVCLCEPQNKRFADVDDIRLAVEYLKQELCPGYDEYDEDSPGWWVMSKVDEAFRGVVGYGR